MLHFSDSLPELWKHQQETKQFVIPRHIVYDASDAGTGKTRPHAEVFLERRNNGGDPILVVAPLGSLQSVWANTLMDICPDVHVELATTPAPNRRKALTSGADVVLINTDGVKFFTDSIKNYRLLEPFGTILIDEITYYKHRTSARSRSARKIMSEFDYRVGLSGTPRSNSVLDIWHQAFLLDSGLRLGTTFSAFRAHVCESSYNGFGTVWKEKPFANRYAYNLLKDIMIRHAYDDVMDTPAMRHTVQPFVLPKRLREAYDELRDEMMLILKNTVVSVPHAAALRQKLHQLACGVVYTDAGPHVVDSARHELIMDLVCARDATVVFYNWTHQRDDLLNIAKKRKVTHEFLDGSTPHPKRAPIIDKFQNGDYQVLFLNPESGSHAITLTRGRTVIWASPQYKPDVAKQGPARIRRGSQQFETENIAVCGIDTVDEIIYDIVHRKGEGLNDFLLLAEKRGGISGIALTP